MTELAASLASIAIVDKLPGAQSVATTGRSPATALDEDRGIKHGRGKKGIINEQNKQAQGAAVTRLPLENNLNSPVRKADRILQQSDEVTLAAAKAAKDFRSWMLEHMKVSINTALDYANGLASVGLPTDSGPAADQPHDHKKNSGMPKLERQLKTAQEYRATAFELMTGNVNTTLEYAQQLANVKSPTEFIELSTNHARKQLELIMTHTAALGALSQSLTRINAERMTASAARVFGQQKPMQQSRVRK